MTSAKVNGNASKKTALLFDGKDSSYWKTGKKEEENLVLNFELSKEQKFDVLLLQENLQIGQRVEQFVLEYKEGTTWKKATEGTTIGYKRLLRFPAVTAKELRLKIISSRLQPAIAEVGLYLRPEGSTVL
ncbi:F5/8 type C domain protein [compost metagenome]